ncbi:MAG: hypothetical protein ACE5H2_03180, partial [Terriglobia bacterium]
MATAENVQLQRDVATLVLAGGQLALAQPVEGRVFATAFKGRGRLRFAPRLLLEVQQLRFHSGQASLEAEFTEAVFMFTDNTLEELSRQVNFRSGDATKFQKIYWGRNEDLHRYGLSWEPRLLKSLLSEDPALHAFFVAELKTQKHGWVSLIVDEADPEQVELVQFDRGRRARNIWSKFPKAGRRPQEAFAHPLGHHEYRLQGYRLDVTVQSNAKLEAEAQVELLLGRAGERVLLFALDPNLRVSEVTDSASRALGFLQPKEHKDRFFLGNYLVVVAPEPFAPGPHTLRFRYAGKRIVRKEGAGTYFCQSFGWYPTYSLGRVSLNTNEFAARVDFDLTLRVPKKYEAVAVGSKVEDRKEKKYRVTRWQSELPLAVAGFAFGDYKVQTEPVGQIQVEVYANRKPDDLLRGLEIAGAGGDLPSFGGSRIGLPALGSLAPARLGT